MNNIIIVFIFLYNNNNKSLSLTNNTKLDVKERYQNDLIVVPHFFFCLTLLVKIDR